MNREQAIHEVTMKFIERMAATMSKPVTAVNAELLNKVVQAKSKPASMMPLPLF